MTTTEHTPMTAPDLTKPISAIPYRAALAGGWIDQPFVSKLNPDGVGSMVTVALQPIQPFMDRAGMATGTRIVARRIWGDRLPKGRSRAELVRELYAEENKHQADPSGSQDMVGLIYPGVNRLDFDYSHEGGYFPRHVETNTDPAIAAWVERVLHVIAVAPRPPGYNPLGEKNLTPQIVRKLGQTGKDCFDAIVARDLAKLGKSMNDCMDCWATMMPHIVRHPTVTADLVGILQAYQARYPGAMYSGCGGGYLYVVSEEPVPGAFKVKVRLED
jgi:hypothetical protein